MNDFLIWLKGFIEEVAPALAVMLWDYEHAKLDEAQNKELDAETNLQLEKNHEAIDQKYSGKPDIDAINDAITSGGGQPGESDSTDKPTSEGDDDT